MPRRLFFMAFSETRRFPQGYVKNLATGPEIRVVFDSDPL